MFGPRISHYGTFGRIGVTILLSIIVYLTIIRPFSADRQTHSNAAPTVGELEKDQSKLDLLTPNATCQNPDISGRVVVVLRTGATEAYTKLPTQLLTALRCVPNLLIVSDMEQELAGHHIHDVLKNVSPNIRENHPDFELYRQQRVLQSQGLFDNIEKLLSSKYKNQKDREKAARTLDKYKYFHMMYLAWEKYSQKDWFVFIEADTYLVWPSLLRWLDTLDSTKELFLGSPLYKSDDRLAHGGSGIVLSNSALRKMAVDHASDAVDLDARMKVHLSGDYLLAKAAQEWNISVQGVWPMLGGESPTAIPYGPAAWCEPAITLHGLTPGEVQRVRTFDKNRSNPSRPILHRDLFRHFIGELPSKRDDWSNTCAGTVFEIDDIKADLGRARYEDCERACLDFPQCFQFSYLDGAQCHLYTCFSLGKPAEPDNVKHWRSGWITWRIKDWIDTNSECAGSDWVRYSEENIRHTGWPEIDVGIDKVEDGSGTGS